MRRFVSALAGAAVLALAVVIGMSMIPRTPPDPNGAAAATPTPTTEPARTPASSGLCKGYDDFSRQGGAYTKTVSTVRVTARVPSGWYGLSWFLLKKTDICLIPGQVELEIEPVGEIYVDACDPAPGTVKVRSREAAIDALVAQRSHATSEPTDVTIGPHVATWVDISVPWDDPTPCVDPTFARALWTEPGDEGGFGGGFDRGSKTRVYIIEVDGTLLALVARRSDEFAIANVELDGVIASLRFEPGSATTP